MIAQSKHENNKPSLLFCNLKEFHDESYQQFLEDLNRRLKPDSESLKSKWLQTTRLYVILIFYDFYFNFIFTKLNNVHKS